MQELVALHPGILFLIRCLLSWFFIVFYRTLLYYIWEIYLISISSFMSISSPLLSKN